MQSVNGTFPLCCKNSRHIQGDDDDEDNGIDDDNDEDDNNDDYNGDFNYDDNDVWDSNDKITMLMLQMTITRKYLGCFCQIIPFTSQLK